jgi:hypothetical protein
MGIKCFGAEPIDFVFGNGWKVTAVQTLFILFFFLVTKSFKI